MSEEITRAQLGAYLMMRMLQHGPIRVSEEAARLGVDGKTVRRPLEEMSAAHFLPIANDRGFWYMQSLNPAEDDFDAARRLLREMRAELAATPRGVGFCRAMRRRDFEALANLLARLVESAAPVDGALARRETEALP